MYLRERTVIFNMDLKFDKLTLLITLTYLKHLVPAKSQSPSCLQHVLRIIQVLFTCH